MFAATCMISAIKDHTLAIKKTLIHCIAPDYREKMSGGKYQAQ